MVQVQYTLLLLSGENVYTSAKSFKISQVKRCGGVNISLWLNLQQQMQPERRAVTSTLKNPAVCGLTYFSPHWGETHLASSWWSI